MGFRVSGSRVDQKALGPFLLWVPYLNVRGTKDHYGCLGDEQSFFQS